VLVGVVLADDDHLGNRLAGERRQRSGLELREVTTGLLSGGEAEVGSGVEGTARTPEECRRARGRGA
jgi:hypothetical protein